MAVEKAKAQGGVDMDRVKSMIAKIGNGVSGVTSTLMAQMGTEVSRLSDKATNDAIQSGKQMKTTVDATGQLAGKIGSDFTAALESITKGENAAKQAQSQANKDVYTIASLLKSTGQETQQKVLALLKQIESGEKSVDQALAAAKDMSGAQVNTVQDVIEAFSSYIGSHLGNVNKFKTGITGSSTAITAAVKRTIGDHEAIQADTVGDMAADAKRLADMKSRLLPGADPASQPGLIKQMQDERDSRLDGIENYVTSVVSGSASKTATITSSSSAPASRSTGGVFLQKERTMAPYRCSTVIRPLSPRLSRTRSLTSRLRWLPPELRLRPRRLKLIPMFKPRSPPPRRRLTAFSMPPRRLSECLLSVTTSPFRQM